MALPVCLVDGVTLNRGFDLISAVLGSSAPLGLKFNTLVDSGDLGQRSLQKQLRDLQGRNNLHYREINLFLLILLLFTMLCLQRGHLSYLITQNIWHGTIS
ncbi:hypothetical protein RRG08_061838 [Elysia crispata]|uniref:Uncharacterized protein n=1 Tax=Elysia crispata TaxID=231223 RepID=A0AAE1A1K9_9GAST|nr:hypothetical protein RRG08_061838 [Elysia crispata]